MTAFRFLHAADIHLDSPLHGLSRYDGVPADEVRVATRTALNNLVDAAIDEGVAFVVLAGDLYDGDWPDFGTGLFLCAAMGRLERAGIDVYLLHGNHDAESVLTKKLPLPANVRVFGNRKPETFIHEPTAAALHGWSYRDKDTRENLAATYPAPVPNCLNIGVLHTALTGRPPHAPYAPCTIQDLSAKGYDYWALGHVHTFEIVWTSPLIVFPGNLQGRSIKEVGPKGAVLVSVDDGGISAQPLTLDAVRWARVDLDVTGVDTEFDFHSRLRAELQRAWTEQAEAKPLVVRVTISGPTTLHGALSSKSEGLRADVRAIAVSISELLWVEKVKLRTSRILESNPGEGGLRDELSALLSRAGEDQDLIGALRAELSEFFAKTPPDLGSDDEFLGVVREGDLSTLLEEAASALDARLTGNDG